MFPISLHNVVISVSLHRYCINMNKEWKRQRDAISDYPVITADLIHGSTHCASALQSNGGGPMLPRDCKEMIMFSLSDNAEKCKRSEWRNEVQV